MRRRSSNSESGAILAIVIILMLALTITGIAFLNAGVMEYRLAKREDYKNKAFYIAEGGLERTLWNLQKHFEIDFEAHWPENSVTWPTGFINGIPVSASSSWTIDYGGEDSLPGDLGGGSYVVTLEYIPSEDKVRIESTGTFKDTSRIVQIYMEPREFFPFDAAIFAGESAMAGSIINGNVRVHGSIVILGEHISGSEEPAVDLMEWLGNAGIRNNYEGMKADIINWPWVADLEKAIPELPLVLYDEEPYSPEVRSLKATLRVRDGAVKVGGNVTIGEDNTLLPDVKGFMDGLYVDRGFTVSGDAHLYYDDYEESSGLGGITFPTLTEPGPETSGVPRIDYLTDPLNWVHLPSTITEISINTPSFWADESGEEYGIVDPSLLPDPEDLGGNHIIWNQADGLLYIGGIINIPVDHLKLGEKNERIKYSGSGIIVVAKRDTDDDDPEREILGEIRVHGDLLAEGEYLGEGTDGFPNNVLGLVTGDLQIAGPGETFSMATGAFFAENIIHSDKQNQIAGTFITRQFNIGTNIPRLYQVPALKDKVPAGMPGGEAIRYAVFTRWSEV